MAFTVPSVIGTSYVCPVRLSVTESVSLAVATPPSASDLSSCSMTGSSARVDTARMPPRNSISAASKGVSEA